jgi:hypothetical protein
MKFQIFDADRRIYRSVTVTMYKKYFHKMLRVFGCDASFFFSSSGQTPNFFQKCCGYSAVMRHFFLLHTTLEHDDIDESHHQVLPPFPRFQERSKHCVCMILSLDDRPITAADQSIRVLPLP